MRTLEAPECEEPRTHYTPAVCDFVDCSWVTLVYSCLVLVSCTTNVFCILYSVFYVVYCVQLHSPPAHLASTARATLDRVALRSVHERPPPTRKHEDGLERSN